MLTLILLMQIFLIIRLKKKYDAIVSNPPYVRESEKALMKSNVLKYEPELALYVSDDNALIYYNSILDFSKSNLDKNGKIYLEINENYKDQMSNLLKNQFYNNVNFIKDINEKYRFCITC